MRAGDHAAQRAPFTRVGPLSLESQLTSRLTARSFKAMRERRELLGGCAVGNADENNGGLLVGLVSLAERKSIGGGPKSICQVTDADDKAEDYRNGLPRPQRGRGIEDAWPKWWR